MRRGGSYKGLSEVDGEKSSGFGLTGSSRSIRSERSYGVGQRYGLDEGAFLGGLPSGGECPQGS